MIYFRLHYGQAGTLSLQMIYIHLQHGQAGTLSLHVGWMATPWRETGGGARERARYGVIPFSWRAFG